MLTSKCLNSIEAGSFPIDSVDYRSVISPIALVDTVGMFVERTQFLLILCISVCSSVDCQYSDHYFGFPRQCNIERDGDPGVPNDKSWIQKWHNVVFSDGSRFCMQYSDGHIRGWKSRGDRTSPACIQYRHSGPAHGVMVWASIGYTTHTSLVLIDGNLNTDGYFSDILCPVVMSYLRGLAYCIFQQASRPHVACVVTFLDIQGIRLLPWPARSPDLSPVGNIWSWVE